jgi:thioredoxin
MKKIFLSIIFAFIAFASFSQEVVFLSDATFKEKVWDYGKNTEFVFSGDKPVIVDFYADWCGPCKMVAPHLEDIQTEYGNKLHVYKVNVDNYGMIAELFNIRSIPTILFIPANGDYKKIIGYRSKEQLVDLIKTNFSL